LALAVPERAPDTLALERPSLDESRPHPECDVIRARTPAELLAATRLLEPLYAARGYLVSRFDPDPDLDVVLLATQRGEEVGTLTLRFDSPLGLRADDAYGNEIDLLRAKGRNACEVGRFAVARSARSTVVIGALFHCVHRAVRERADITDLFIEVNPRHVPFYRRAFGFRVAARERTCPRVLAPSVLLRLEVDAFEEGSGLAVLAPGDGGFARGLLLG
jgi:hypothetical protein